MHTVKNVLSPKVDSAPMPMPKSHESNNHSAWLLSRTARKVSTGFFPEASRSTAAQSGRRIQIESESRTRTTEKHNVSQMMNRTVNNHAAWLFSRMTAGSYPQGFSLRLSSSKTQQFASANSTRLSCISLYLSTTTEIP